MPIPKWKKKTTSVWHVHASIIIAELTKELRGISDQIISGKSGIQGFKIGVSAALLALAGSAGAAFSTILDKTFHG